ncbi:MAG TPA: P1 family peptidase [Thermoplasmata archaeon]|nr:P1 family peptidase [Thermoplasmata archaeon]
MIPLGSSTAPGARTARQRGTTLVAAVTDAALSRSALQRLAIYAHDGLARAIDPAHTATDGDVVFVSTTNHGSPARRERYPGSTVDRLGIALQGLVADAVLRSVRFRRADEGRPASEGSAREARG